MVLYEPCPFFDDKALVNDYVVLKMGELFDDFLTGGDNFQI